MKRKSSDVFFAKRPFGKMRYDKKKLNKYKR